MIVTVERETGPVHDAGWMNGGANAQQAHEQVSPMLAAAARSG
jgi:hypothetical protein